MAVGGDVEGFVIVKELKNIRGGRRIDHRSGNDLIHRFVVGWFGRIVDKAGAAAVNGARKKGHTDRFLVGNALESADQVRAFKILSSYKHIVVRDREEPFQRVATYL